MNRKKTLHIEALPIKHDHKRRGHLWILTPTAMVITGLILGGLNSAVPNESPIHVILNLVSFLLIAPGLLLVVPGLIYGIYLINKK